ncbi:MAG: TRAP transporter substrate-binding protein [Firmicutes bacterium]|jgi:tripartite ATP-independent transporter DctP family solute receptor|nr:TRAP transporter substrate-binding protein [Bacillota bacterium]
MVRVHRVTRILAAVALLVMTGSLSAAAAGPKVVLKFAHVMQTDHAYHLMAEKFKEEAEKLSGNQIEVQIFPAGQLGNERDLVEGLQIGTIDISTVTSALTSGFVPGFKVFSLPFLFRDFDHLFQIMDGPIGAKLEEDMKKAGLVKLGFVSGGSRSLYSRTPIRNLAELKGKKIRTMEDPIYLDTWNALGALATPIPWGDVYLSLQQGIVDGAEGALISYQAMGFYEPAPYVTVINYIFSWHNLMMSKRTWDKLPADLRAAVVEAGKRAQEFERAYVSDFEENLIKLLETKHKVAVFYPADMDAWIKAVNPVFQKRARDVGGMDLIESIINTGK